MTSVANDSGTSEEPAHSGAGRSVHAATHGAVAAFEFLLAPALRLPEAGQLRPLERAVLAADHMLYGYVLGEGHRRPQE